MKYLLMLLISFGVHAALATPLTEKEAIEIGTKAYVYGYPLVTMETTRKISTNVATPEGAKAPMGQFAHLRKYPDAKFKDVTAPNADTLYSVAWLDLTAEPFILDLPDADGRYFLMPMLSAWTDVFHSPGTRTTGTKAQKLAITGPAWKGKLPAGVTKVTAPTNLVWILGRTFCTGTEEDYKKVHALQDRYLLYPLSAYGKKYVPPTGVVDPQVDAKTATRNQVEAKDAKTYFTDMARLLKQNPPAKADAPALAEFAKIGLVPGKNFNFEKLSPTVATALAQVPKLAVGKIMAFYPQAGKIENGWLVTTGTGTYGINYYLRALVTAVGLGANLPQDAVYPMAKVDRDGQPFVGAEKYVLHFEKDQTPPVNGFWSLTMYDDKFFFVENPLNRFTLSPRDALKFNPDGSLDIYVQATSPGADREANWLPAPKEQFVLMLRTYWPKPAIIDGTWKPPVVKKVAASENTRG